MTKQQATRARKMRGLKMSVESIARELGVTVEEVRGAAPPKQRPRPTPKAQPTTRSGLLDGIDDKTIVKVLDFISTPGCQIPKYVAERFGLTLVQAQAIIAAHRDQVSKTRPRNKGGRILPDHLSTPLSERRSIDFANPGDFYHLDRWFAPRKR